MARTHTCKACSLVVSSSVDMAIHWTQNHHHGRVAQSERIRRTWFCWRCAGENQPDASTCACGFDHPLITQVATR